MSSGTVSLNVADLTPSEISLLGRFRNKVGDYAQLSKPRIVLLFMVTGIAGMVVEGSLLLEPLRFWMVALGILFTAASANALNQYIDRDIDAVMERTRKKRPLPQGRLTPAQALTFAIAIGIIATALLVYFGTWLSAALGVGTIAFYVGIYTMWLKRRTPYNIVIGGAAGATAPLMGWAAATGSISWAAFFMFLIIFMWTPPHFWALALCIQDEYAEVSVPMLPVVAGEKVTRDQILLYSLSLPLLAVAPYFTGNCGLLYAVSAAVLSLEFVRRAISIRKTPDKIQTWKMFGYSIVYLLVLFIVMIVDALLK